MEAFFTRHSIQTNRVPRILTVGGVATCVITFGIDEVFEYIEFFDAMFNRPYNYWGYKIAFLIGAPIAIAGYVCAFHYEQTAGALISWVKTGDK